MALYKKHWTKFLSDVGRPVTMKGDELEMLEARIERAERELKRLRLEQEQSEDLLFAEVREDWTIEEITEAKEKATK